MKKWLDFFSLAFWRNLVDVKLAMGGGGGGGSTKFDWNDAIAPYWEQTLAQGQALSEQPLQQYGGPRVAPINGDQGAAMQNIRLFASDPTYGVKDPNTALNNGIDEENATLTGQYLNGPMANPYGSASNPYGGMDSPYFKSMLDSGLGEIGAKYRDFTAPDTAGQFAMNGTIGGTDYDRAVSNNQSALAKQMATYTSGLQNDQYNRSGMFADSQLTRGNADYEAERQRQIGVLSPTQAEGPAALARQTALMGVGDAERSYGQQTDDVAYQNFLEARGYPQSQLGWMSSLLTGAQGGLGPGGGASQSYTPTASSNFSNILGTALAGYGMFRA